MIKNTQILETLQELGRVQKYAIASLFKLNAILFIIQR